MTHVKVKKVKCTLVQALSFCSGRTAQRGSRGITLLFLDYGTRRGWGVSVTPRALFTPGKDPVIFVQEACWAPGPVRTGAKNLAPIGIRSMDLPARSQSLYRLRYPAYIWFMCFCLYWTWRYVSLINGLHEQSSKWRQYVKANGVQFLAIVTLQFLMLRWLGHRQQNEHILTYISFIFPRNSLIRNTHPTMRRNKVCNTFYRSWILVYGNEESL